MRQLLDRKTATLLLSQMMVVRPALPFLATTAVQMFIYDQKYCKKGASRGKHRGAKAARAGTDDDQVKHSAPGNEKGGPSPAPAGPPWCASRGAPRHDVSAGLRCTPQPP